MTGQQLRYFCKVTLVEGQSHMEKKNLCKIRRRTKIEKEQQWKAQDRQAINRTQWNTNAEVKANN